MEKPLPTHLGEELFKCLMLNVKWCIFILEPQNPWPLPLCLLTSSANYVKILGLFAKGGVSFEAQPVTFEKDFLQIQGPEGRGPG
jgi:hypothetical protein